MAPLHHPGGTNMTVSNASISKKMLHMVEQLSVEEKVALLSGHDFSSTVGIPRLSIPALKLADSTSAVKGASFGNPMTTACFPNTSSLAATWNRDILGEMGVAIAGQAKAKAAQVILGPTVNIHRDPRGGRNFESFSEDPVLTGQLAAALVGGIQSQGMGTCLKHFVCNECETKRKKYSANVDERTLREIYMAPFQWIVREAKPLAIMTAYNQLNGTYASESPLIKDVVRQEWGFDGLIMSDWFGTESRIKALEAGLDLEMPGPSKCRGKALVEDIMTGRIGLDVIDQRVIEILKLVFRTSEVHSTAAEESGQDDATNALARKVASESMVLLKNNGSVLPLNFKSRPKIALIGQLATEYSGGGGSAAGIPQYIQRPSDCIKDTHPEPDLITLSSGVKLHRAIPMVSPKSTVAMNGRPGVDITYYNDGSDEPVLTEYQPPAIVFMLGHVKSGLNEAGFTYEMKTSLTPDSTGKHTLAVTATGAFQLFIDGKEVMTGSEPDMIVEDFLFVPWNFEKRCTVTMNAKQSYAIKLVVSSRRRLEADEPTPHSAKICYLEEFSDEQAIHDAAQAASNADVSLVFAGRHAEWESEGSDLADLKLPNNQDTLIKSVAKMSSKTVVILYGGNPFDVSHWIDDVDAVIFAQYPGQEGGAALADLLSGTVSPSGKLPMTWPKSIESAPTFGNFPGIPREAGGPMLDYKEGMKIGYRYYWAQTGEDLPRYHFGHGLSYTTFAFSELKVRRKVQAGSEDVVLEVSVEVENTGSVAGAEVVQVNIEDVDATVWRPSKELKGFSKVFLQPGKKEMVTVDLLEKYALSYWDEKEHRWLAEAGEFRVHVGSLSAPLALERSYGWNGL